MQPIYQRSWFCKKNQGATLFELLLAITLSLFVMTFMCGLYLGAEAQHRRQNELNFLLENLKLATEILSHELQWAGYLGCPVLRVKNSTSYTGMPQNAIEVIKDPGGGEMLVVQHRSAASSSLIKPMENRDELYLSADLPIEENDMLLISDCKSADIFQVDQVTKLASGEQRIVTRQALQRQYSPTAEVGQLEINSYWIEDKRGLQRRDRRGHKMELLKGVTAMHFLWDNRRSGLSIQLELSQGSLHKTAYVFVRL